jgi:hypothetical protein
MTKVIREGDTFKIQSQGHGNMTVAGAGEQHLLSMFGALGLPIEELQGIMDNMIPPVVDET